MQVKRKKTVLKKITTGWEEWCSLPELGLPAIKAKVDTGARTSALHAFAIEPFKKGKEQFVRFKVHPIQRSKKITVQCEAKVHDRREVKNTSGHIEERFVILTPLKMGGMEWDIEVTLTNRAPMRIRMLIGRQAVKKRMLVDPGRTYRFGHISPTAAVRHYRQGNTK